MIKMKFNEKNIGKILEIGMSIKPFLEKPTYLNASCIVAALRYDRDNIGCSWTMPDVLFNASKSM